MSEPSETVPTVVPPPRHERARHPGTVFECPECELGTLDYQTLRTHWVRRHADEHGLFCHADITVREGP